MKSIIITCTLVAYAVIGVLATPISTERDIICPSDDHDCGHTTVCSIYDCNFCPDFPGCGTEAEPRAAFLAKRKLECPAGLDCDFAPDCTIYDCGKYPSLRGCGGEVELHSLEVERVVQTSLHEQSCALVCDNDRCLYVPEPEKEKRNSEFCKEKYVADHQRCVSTSEPPNKKRNPQDDLWCFVNPIEQDVCMIPYAARKEKRAAESDFVLPCPFICNEGGCACTGENTTSTAEKEKRAPSTDFPVPCPFICNQQGECVCAGGNLADNAEKEKRAPSADFPHPCLLVCDQNGCRCESETEKRATETDLFLPYPFDCNENGTCTCDWFDEERKCCVAPEQNSTDCIITKRNTDIIQKRDTAFIHPCPPICDENGHCVCATESTKPDTDFIDPCPPICDENGNCGCATKSETMKRDTDYRGPPCPSANLICNKSGCKCGGSFTVPVNPPKLAKRDEDFRGPPCPEKGLICNTLGCECSGTPHVPIDPPKIEERHTAFIPPCPPVCDQSGHCGCAIE